MPHALTTFLIETVLFAGVVFPVAVVGAAVALRALEMVDGFSPESPGVARRARHHRGEG